MLYYTTWAEQIGIYPLMNQPLTQILQLSYLILTVKEGRRVAGEVRNQTMTEVTGEQMYFETACRIWLNIIEHVALRA